MEEDEEEEERGEVSKAGAVGGAAGSSNSARRNRRADVGCGSKLDIRIRRVDRGGRRPPLRGGGGQGDDTGSRNCWQPWKALVITSASRRQIRKLNQLAACKKLAAMAAIAKGDQMTSEDRYEINPPASSLLGDADKDKARSEGNAAAKAEAQANAPPGAFIFKRGRLEINYELMIGDKSLEQSLRYAFDATVHWRI